MCMIADENDTIIALGWMFSAMQVRYLVDG